MRTFGKQWTASQSQKKPRSDGEAGRIYYNRYRWAFWKREMEKSVPYWSIKTELERKGMQTEERDYYISNCCLTVQELLHHARMEWDIETMHWILDVHYSEDYCRM